MSPLMPKIYFNTISSPDARTMPLLPPTNRTHMGKKRVFLLSHAAPQFLLIHWCLQPLEVSPYWLGAVFVDRLPEVCM